MECKCGHTMANQGHVGCLAFWECWKCERKAAVHDNGTIQWWELVETEEATA